jgi:hypothetical protein
MPVLFPIKKGPLDAAPSLVAGGYPSCDFFCELKDAGRESGFVKIENFASRT